MVLFFSPTCTRALYTVSEVLLIVYTKVLPDMCPDLSHVSIIYFDEIARFLKCFIHNAFHVIYAFC